MEYKSYQHIEKLGKSEVEGILTGKVYLSYKIDGTNACIFLKDDGSLGYGSRNKELITEDNAGFKHCFIDDPKYLKTRTDLEAYLHKHSSYIIYGEWLVKHTLKTYSENAWKHFYVFDIYDVSKDEYINYDNYSIDFQTNYPHIDFIPLITTLDKPTEEDIKALLPSTGNWLVTSGLGEGIVIKNYSFKNKYGRRTWAKLLTEDFFEKKTSLRATNGENKQEHQVEYEIIKLMTDEHIFKEKNKIVEKYDGEDFLKHMAEVLEVCYKEFLHDNWEFIIFKKFKASTIDLRLLRQMSNDRVKDVLLHG